MTHTKTQPCFEVAAKLTQLAERYQLITTAAAFDLCRDLFQTKVDAKNALHQLVEDGALRRAPLYQGLSCFIPPTREGGKPLSETTKIRALAMLSVCAHQSQSRTRLTASELEKYFPDLNRPGLPMNYYVDLARDQPKLGFLRVDTVGRGRWDRIVAKALDDVRKHQLETAFSRFIERNALEIRVVTALKQKANRISRALKDKPTSLGRPIEVSVVPELLNLIAPIPK